MSGDLQDQELLRRYLREGSEEAFCLLVRRHVDLVYGAAFRQLNSRAAAEEIAQNVFIALGRRAPFLTGHPSLAGWLYHTAANQARQQHRGDQRRRLREEVAAQLGNTMQPDESNSLAPVLDEALLELRAADREALVLRYFENKSLREVGAALGLREDAAQKRVAKALDALTDRFRRRGFAVSAVTATTAAAALRAAAQSAPAGLAPAVARAALSVSGAATVASAGLLFGKFMALTKTQTALVCALLAAAPIAYEWNAAANAGAGQKNLQLQLAQVQGDLAEKQKSLDQLQGRLKPIDGMVARLRGDTRQQHALASAARAAAAANLYLWSDASAYVRLPKSMINQLRLVTPEKKVPLDDSGAEPLKEALGMTPEETAGVMGAFLKLEQNFQALAQTHLSFQTNQPPKDFQVGNRDSLTVLTAAFPTEGAALRQDLENSLQATLGSERAGVLWQQAGDLFHTEFNDFGASQRIQTAIVNSNGAISFWVAIQGLDGEMNGYSNTSGATEANSVPEPLRPFIAARLKDANHKPGNHQP